MIYRLEDALSSLLPALQHRFPTVILNEEITSVREAAQTSMLCRPADLCTSETEKDSEMLGTACMAGHNNTLTYMSSVAMVARIAVDKADLVASTTKLIS